MLKNNMKITFIQHKVRRLLGNVLRRTVSATTFRSIRFRWWCLWSYFPRLIASSIIKRPPYVRGFGTSLIPADLVKQLESVNSAAPTKMCRVMTKYGSDKGRLHSYTTVYSALFKERCDQSLRVLELGLGSNNLDTPSNMGPFGAPGASLRGWRELFPHALVFGADVDRRILFQEDRIKTFYCNQLDRSSIRKLWEQPDLRGGVDIIIEDGLHTFEANDCFLQESLDHLRPGGIYITEDIMWNDVDEWCDKLKTVYSKRYPEYEFAFVVFPHGVHGERYSLLVARRKAD